MAFRHIHSFYFRTFGGTMQDARAILKKKESRRRRDSRIETTVLFDYRPSRIFRRRTAASYSAISASVCGVKGLTGMGWPSSSMATNTR